MAKNAKQKATTIGYGTVDCTIKNLLVLFGTEN